MPKYELRNQNSFKICPEIKKKIIKICSGRQSPRAPMRQNNRPHAQNVRRAPKCPPSCPNARRAPKYPPACPKRAPGAKMPARVPKRAPSLMNYLKIKISKKPLQKKEDESSLISRPKRLRRLIKIARTLSTIQDFTS